jgi:hypothetical protein
VIKLMISLALSAAFMAGASGLVKETLPKGNDKPVHELLKKYKKGGRSRSSCERNSWAY